jgi:hypothetical protein
MMLVFKGLTCLAGDMHVSAVFARLSHCEIERGGEG